MKDLPENWIEYVKELGVVKDVPLIIRNCICNNRRSCESRSTIIWTAFVTRGGIVVKGAPLLSLTNLNFSFLFYVCYV